MKRKNKNKIQKLEEKAEIFILCFFALVILLIGCHYEATYVVDNCRVVSKTETTIEIENLNNNVGYECRATETENIKVGEKLCCKFTNECTESNPYDDHLIGFGKKHFLCFVW